MLRPDIPMGAAGSRQGPVSPSLLHDNLVTRRPDFPAGSLMAGLSGRWGESPMRPLSVFAFRTARLAGTLLALALTGCAAPQMRTLSSYQGPALPRPDGVLVHDFAVTPQEVKLDRGISARAMQAVQDPPRSDLEAGVGRKVAQTISESVVKEL